MTPDSPRRDAARPFDTATDAKYVRLTTFRKDGTAVSSALWAADDAGKLVMFTPAESWKVKRLRRDRRVVVQECDRTGSEVSGEPVTGTAQIVAGDTPEMDQIRQTLIKKYGIIGRLVVTGSVWRRGKSGTVGLVLTADA
ncbi:PPOX class F420-dependent oxidoreductase [Gordonia sinesedis]